jgi:uncharacterized membrane protein YhaH (DUF805 family)
MAYTISSKTARVLEQLFELSRRPLSRKEFFKSALIVLSVRQIPLLASPWLFNTVQESMPYGNLLVGLCVLHLYMLPCIMLLIRRLDATGIVSFPLPAQVILIGILAVFFEFVHTYAATFMCYAIQAMTLLVLYLLPDKRYSASGFSLRADGSGYDPPHVQD